MALVTPPEEASGRRIVRSGVAAKRPGKAVFSGRKWNDLDVGAGRAVLGFHLLALPAPFQFTWGAFWVFVSLYVATGLFGITLSYHRNLAHRSFKLPKALEYLFAYCGVFAFQGSPIDWVSVHRYHHKFTDSEKDPHSPIEGFWYSHIGWVFDTKSVMEKCGGKSNAGFWYTHMTWLFHSNSLKKRSGGTSNVGDLEKQPFYRFIQKTYILHIIALGFLLYALGGLPFIVWGLGVRTVWVFHITWLVNSACHVWGRQVWNTGDLSRNNWWVALLTFGEGWHNNHHAFEHSARQGLEWWQLDMTWVVIRLLQALGLAYDVKLPSHAQKMRMAIDGY